MADPKIRRLANDDDRGSFSCGNEALDSFFRDRVGQYERRRLGRTYVAVLPDTNQIVGYYTISASSLTANRSALWFSFNVETLRDSVTRFSAAR